MTVIHSTVSIGIRDVDIREMIHIANVSDQPDIAYCFAPLSTIHNPHYHY